MRGGLRTSKSNRSTRGRATNPSKVRAPTTVDARRSANMRAIRSTGMRPEMVVRRLAHSMGFRYRLHRTDLPGRPDLVFPSRRKIIFVHGCFWHSHHCNRAHAPRSNAEYWREKLARNRRRDARHIRALAALGWSSLIVWECETSEAAKLRPRLATFLTAKRGKTR